MTTLTINMPTESVTVSTRGIDRTIAYADLPHDVLCLALDNGLQQKLADCAAAALSQAYDANNPDHKLSGDALKDARKAWGEANPDIVTEHGESMFDAGIARLLAGEWTSRAASYSDPLEKYRAQAVRMLISENKKSAVYKAYTEIDSSDQAARREFLLSLIVDDNREYIERMAEHLLDDAVDKAQREKERKAALKGKVKFKL